MPVLKTQEHVAGDVPTFASTFRGTPSILPMKKQQNSNMKQDIKTFRPP
jgi:hypothetical protein